MFSFAPKPGIELTFAASPHSSRSAACPGGKHSLDLCGHLKKLPREPREQLALCLVGRELADEIAILGIEPKLFQLFFQVLHGDN